LKPAWAQKVHKSLFRKTLHKHKAGGVAQGEGPEFKPQYRQKKKKRKTFSKLSTSFIQHSDVIMKVCSFASVYISSVHTSHFGHF
jgi:hypothetical protein